ncbi:MAG: glycerate kinase [Clostridia bacterium]|nr:glycerate kinase [Clostridia bacterium]
MKIIIAPDSFKGSLSASLAAEALARGVRRVDPRADCRCLPIADGGEGTLDTLVSPAEMQRVTVRGTNGAPVMAEYGLRGSTAVIEMARASGLTLVPAEERNPLIASTYGVGELIRNALDRGCREILLTVGGSGTNDGGSGMFCALGGRLLDADGALLEGGGACLERVAKVDAAGLDPRLSECSFTIASDVTNPLLGELGATMVYGKQKGADAALRERLEVGMTQYAACLERACGKTVATVPGCGAGGGLIAPLLAFCNVRIRSGIESVLESYHFDELLEGASLVITGEGRVDAQSCYGKAISGVAEHARAQEIPVYVASGCLGDGWEALLEHGICEVVSLMELAASVPAEERVAYCMANADILLEKAGEKIAHAFLS